MKPSLPHPESLETLRPLLRGEVSISKRKDLGQCFTGIRTGRLLAALAVSRQHRRILDPMAGHGDLLEAAAERAARLKTRSELFGVEIEPVAAKLGDWRLSFCGDEYGAVGGTMIYGNAFSFATWDRLATHVPFDLVITNPPYVRYQTQASGVRKGSVNAPSADEVRTALAALAERLAPSIERPIWDQLIRSYSGLADLSLPSWLLCGLITAPGGVLAMVVPQTWLSRDYARLARYFFLRFFTPLAVVQESGQRWFEDALVPVSLVLGRRLSTDAVLLPLRKRSAAAERTAFIEVSTEAASELSHVGRAFPGNDPEGRFARWVQEGATGTKKGIHLRRVPWIAQRDEISFLCRQAKWFDRLEHVDSRTHANVISIAHAIPSAIRTALPLDLLRSFQSLDESMIRVGQGLRTGCNAFYYVDAIGEGTESGDVRIQTSELFDRRSFSVPSSVLKPVVRKQAELGGPQLAAESLRGRVLDLRGYFLPEDVERLAKLRCIAKRDLQGLRVMPAALANYVRLAIHTRLERGETRTLIPQLSAVKPNGFGPSDEWDGLPGLQPESMRMWYMLPAFAPRHLAAVFLPRIIHEAPAAVFNAQPPVLVDANFSTLWSVDPTCPGELIFALFSSTWVKFCMEALGTPLGGGALKLEATHLRRLPLPVVSDAQKAELVTIARALLHGRGMGTNSLQARLDHIVFSALRSRRLKAVEAQDFAIQVSRLILSMRRKRRLKSAV